LGSVTRLLDRSRLRKSDPRCHIKINVL
jgi:hypothetical protein